MKNHTVIASSFRRILRRALTCAGLSLLACGALTGRVAAQDDATPAPPAPAAGSTPIELPVPPHVPSDFNILILALDDVDIHSVRSSSLDDLKNEKRPKVKKDELKTSVKPDDKDRSVTPAKPTPVPPKTVPLAVPGIVPANPAPAPRKDPAITPAQPAIVPALPPAPEDKTADKEPEKKEPPAITPASSRSNMPTAFWRAFADQRVVLPDSRPNAGIPALPSPTNSVAAADLELPSRRPPGRAQAAAAALRRALLAAGGQDILISPLDGATVLRPVNSGRLTIRDLDHLRYATGLMVDAVAPLQLGPENLDEKAMAKVNRLTPELARAREVAIESASRIGLSLGFRAVIVLSIPPESVNANGVYSLLLVDAINEKGEALAVLQQGASALARDRGAGTSATQLLAPRLDSFPPFTDVERRKRIDNLMDDAKADLKKGDIEAAREKLNLVTIFDPSYADAFLLLGDALQKTDPTAAAQAYQQAADINTKDGKVWAKIALVHTLSSPPDWVRSIQASNKALELGYDSANLRTAMAAAEFGRADLLRRGGRIDQAEDAEAKAKQYLDRARELAPDDPEVVASVSRMMANYLLEQKRYREAVQSLELLVVQYPKDLKTQTMYAQALEGLGGRQEDLFLAWARVWKLSGEGEVVLDSVRYAQVADGFDQRLVNLAKNIFQLTGGVASGAYLRETALLQLERAKSELKTTVDALNIMRPPAGRAVNDAQISRQFAGDLMQQAFEFYRAYLETGQEINRVRAVELHRQAIENLNIARTGSVGSTLAEPQ